METMNIQNNLFGAAEARAASASPLQRMTGQQRPDAVQNQESQRPEPEAKAMDMEKLREMVEQTNQSMEMQNRRLMFSVNEDTGIKLIQVFDRDTDKLVRQFPPEEYVGVVKQIQQMMPDESKGLMFKEQA
jgi:flagellar protein FlaG